MEIQETLCFDDVLLKPQYSDIESRSEVDISTTMKGQEFSLPVVSSPMDTVTEDQMARRLHYAGGLGIIHRYCSLLRLKEILEANHPFSGRGIAIDVSSDYEERIRIGLGNDVGIYCIDVAHGHHIMVERAIQDIRTKYGESITLIAGNVATASAYLDLVSWGADAVRVGIGGGCFVEGTKVITSNGLKSIEEIQPGDQVYTHMNRLRKVTKTFTHENKTELVSINGIKSTPNHEYYVLHRSKIEIANDDNIHELAEWISAENLTKDYVLLEKK